MHSSRSFPSSLDLIVDNISCFLFSFAYKSSYLLLGLYSKSPSSFLLDDIASRAFELLLTYGVNVHLFYSSFFKVSINFLLVFRVGTKAILFFVNLLYCVTKVLTYFKGLTF